MNRAPYPGLVAFADDLTGALEVGAKCAMHGAPSVVVVDAEHLDALAGSREVIVLDTETRHLDPASAADRLLSLCEKQLVRTVQFIYKKTDSTLRGNIGSELGTMLGAFPDSAMVYAPAYPALGRTVSQGHLFVHGAPVHRTSFANDMFHPVTESSIPLTIARQTAAPVVVVEHDFRKAPEPGVIHVCDGNSEHDLAQAAGWAMIFNVRLFAGPAGFLQSILIKIGWSPRPLIQWPPIRSGLIVSGSRHEASIDQIEYAKRCGFERDSWCILTLDSQTQAVGRERAMLCGPAVREYVDQKEPDALIVFGGDTAYGVLKAFGLPGLTPLGELLPGVPISSFCHNGRELLLISKAGGFGQPDILMRIIYELV